MTLSEFFFDIPIYTPIVIDESNSGVFEQIVDKYTSEEFIGYNPQMKIDSTFCLTASPLSSNMNYYATGGIGITRIKCKRTDDEFWYFILWQPEKKTLMKVGQYPSIADFHISEIKQYAKVLSSEKLKEFTRAIGLAANGVGIGSFVYLRRIFEYLIFDAFSAALKADTISEDDFKKARMDEKISMLHSYLPAFLVENKNLYSILSLGIHELEEKECLNHFDTLRVGIEIILDERLEDIRKSEKIRIAKNKLSELNSHLKK
jgi:hypothetical protein